MKAPILRLPAVWRHCLWWLCDGVPLTNIQPMYTYVLQLYTMIMTLCTHGIAEAAKGMPSLGGRAKCWIAKSLLQIPRPRKININNAKQLYTITTAGIRIKLICKFANTRSACKYKIKSVWHIQYAYCMPHSMQINCQFVITRCCRRWSGINSEKVARKVEREIPWQIKAIILVLATGIEERIVWRAEAL